MMEGRGRSAGSEGEDRPAGPERLERLRRVLDGVGIGHGVGGAELLDVLWLARVMDGRRTGRAVRAAPPGGEGAGGASEGSGGSWAGGGSDGSGAGGGSGRPGAEGTVPPSAGSAGSARAEGAAASVPEPLPAMPEPGAGPEAEAGVGRRRSLFTAGDTTGTSSSGRARSVRAPGPRALPGMQSLARSMRPLRGFRDHRQRTVVDIDATVGLTAETGVLDVVSRPDRELRHTAVLLVDDSASMRVWRGLVLDVRRLLERGGVFRSVEVHRWNPRRPRTYGSTPRTESPVTLVLTDGVHPAWRTAATGRAVAAWGRTGPVALLSPLPRRLWRGTAFDAQAQLLKAERPFGLSGDLTVLDPLTGSPVGTADGGPERAAASSAAAGVAGGLPVPVLALSPSSLASWARLLTRPGVPRLVDTVMLDVDAADEPDLLLPESPSEESGSGEIAPSGLIEQFRGSFSPQAYQLAVRLSAIRPLSMPVMQLVRTATLPGSSSAIVAEVLLGGLLQPLTEDGPRTALRLPPATRRGDTLYDFKPGVRELLATGLSMEQSIDVVEAVGRVLEPYLGRMPDFAALLADPAGRVALPEGASAFAALVSPAIDRLYPLPSVSSPSFVEVPSVPRAAPSAGPLRFTVLGPELAWRGDEPLRLSPRLRAVLTPLLLSGGGRAVSTERLIDAVWGNTPPRKPERLLHAYVSRLRRELRPEATIVREEGAGYRLRRAPDRAHLPLDLMLAEGYYEDARTAWAADETSRSHTYLTEALALFRGEPLAGVSGRFAEIERGQLAEWRLQMLEARCQLDVRLGHYAKAAADLSTLTAEHPLRERFRSLLMLALHGSGRYADALTVYEDTRRLLTDELGVAPGPELTRVYREVLRRTPVESIELDVLFRRGSLLPPELPSDQGERSAPLQCARSGPGMARRNSAAERIATATCRAGRAVAVSRADRHHSTTHPGGVGRRSARHGGCGAPDLCVPPPQDSRP
ncbi:winged helix-turn-helix domain-containing protein [Streptomyces sp. GMY02]|nr:winged helix-turn-helix domain-containing protein [Streptomyces sp. GMY02]